MSWSWPTTSTSATCAPGERKNALRITKQRTPASLPLKTHTVCLKKFSKSHNVCVVVCVRYRACAININLDMSIDFGQSGVYIGSEKYIERKQD